MAVIKSTSVQPPHLRPSLIRRQGALALLDESFSYRVTLIKAPAGFGKSTLVAQWMDSFACESSGGPSGGWLNVDPVMDSGRSFVGYLIRAVHRALGEKTDALAEVLTSETMSRDVALNHLLAALSGHTKPVVLAIDDLQRLQSAEALTFLQALIDNAPPQLHLILMSRSEPSLQLAGLRAAGEMQRIGEKALRFSFEETAHFLKHSHDINLNAQELQILHDKTEGWIAALQLAGLSMRESGDRSSFITAFSGASGDIATYLMQDVVSCLSQDLLDFLCRTAVLEWFDLDLARAISGNDDAAEMIVLIDRSNLFLTPLNAERTVFRYHHLFAELLRSLPQARTLAPELARLAALNLSARGLEIDAVHYALAAQDMALAAGLVETCCMAAVQLGHITRLRAWLECLPPEVHDQRPRLLLAQAWVYFHSRSPRRALGSVRAARDLLRRQSSQLDPDTFSALWAEMQVLGVGAVSASDRSARAQRMATALLAEVPHKLHFLRGTLSNVLGFCEYSLGKLGPARLAASYGRSAHDQAGSIFGVAYSDLILGLVERSAGNLHLAREHFAEASRTAREALGHGSYAEAMAAIFQAELDYEGNDLATAARRLAKFGTEMEAYGLVVHEMTVRLSSARLMAARGETGRAIAMLAKAESSGTRNHYRRLVAAALNDHVRLLLQTGQPAQARGVLSAYGVHENSAETRGAPLIAHEMEQLALARVLIAEGHAAQAQERLDRIVARLRFSGRLRRLVQVQTVNAVAAFEAGNRIAALNAISEAMEMAFRQDALRSLLDEGERLIHILDWAHNRIPAWSRDVALAGFVARVRAQLGNSAATASPAIQGDGGRRGSMSNPIDLLSPKEAEVAQVLRSGASNREIAEQLSISLDTTKWHLKNIYSKLAVMNRTQAVLMLSKASDQATHPEEW
ncbi:MAG: hypothetical protein CVT70_19150 [Alphaproteobacteria bacterium HGW-Alphaproteobacteria-1]|nr:MAG: hypothetical protein CVT70_19150 [Alphaproteobacteria bacterium HGW-Alphaproteobacteria-1]